MSTAARSYLSPEEYLEIDRAAEQKSEYVDGQMFAMAGGSRNHNLIVTNLARELSLALKGRPCEVYPSDLRIWIPENNRYTYPDASVVCGDPEFLDEHLDTLLNPTLIVEVLSPTTELYDRGKKFERYRSIESLQSYVLVSQDERRVEQYVRQADGRWLFSDTVGEEGVVSLPSIECELKLAEIYDKVILPGDG